MLANSSLRLPLLLSTFFFEKGYDLFTRRSVDALVSDLALPVREKAVFLT